MLVAKQRGMDIIVLPSNSGSVVTRARFLRLFLLGRPDNTDGVCGSLPGLGTARCRKTERGRLDTHTRPRSETITPGMPFHTVFLSFPLDVLSRGWACRSMAGEQRKLRNVLDFSGCCLS